MIHFDKINVRESLEDFLKIEYTDGLQNEFNTMDALINKLKKDTLVGKYKTKSFALGVTDNIRMLGNGNDRYVLTADDYTNAAETAEARFDTTKLMGIFAITDETILDNMKYYLAMELINNKPSNNYSYFLEIDNNIKPIIDNKIKEILLTSFTINYLDRVYDEV